MEKIPESTSFKISDFIFRFRESSQRFVVEILTQNFAFNLSGTLFFIGLGCSLKWWYKDQLLITLLKQNLPAFSEPEQKISWETGEYLIGEQTRYFFKKKHKNKESNSLVASKMQMKRRSSEYHQPFSFTSTSKMQPVYGKENVDKSELETRVCTEGAKNPLVEIGSQMGSYAFPFDEVDFSPSALLAPSALRVRNLYPSSFNETIGSVDADSNPLAINLRSPWQKHAYHRFVGIFPELICADTKHTPSKQILGTTNSSSRKFVNSKSQKYTFWGPAQNWFKLSARGLCILDDTNLLRKLIPNSLFSASKAASEQKLTESAISNRKLAVYTDGIRWEETKNFSYPLEKSSKMNGWQPPVKKLILNSYLDELPYKLENSSKALGAISRQIDNCRLELSNRSNQPVELNSFLSMQSQQREASHQPLAYCKEDIYQKKLETNYPLNQYSEDGFNSNSLFCTPLREYPGAEQAELKSASSQPLSELDKGITGSLPVLMQEKLDLNRFNCKECASELENIKQLLTTELQTLVNSLPVTFVDQSNLFFAKKELTSSRSKYNALFSETSEQEPTSGSTQLHGISASASSMQAPQVPASLKSSSLSTPHVQRSELEKIQTNISQVPDIEESTKRIFFEPKMSAPHAHLLRYAISGSQNKIKDSNFLGIRREASYQPLSVTSASKVEPVYGKEDAYESELEASKPSVGDGKIGAASEIHLADSFSLLNSLGITFNNLSYLKDPPVLLPMNQDASFWKWNRKRTLACQRQTTGSSFLSLVGQYIGCIKDADEMSDMFQKNIITPYVQQGYLPRLVPFSDAALHALHAPKVSASLTNVVGPSVPHVRFNSLAKNDNSNLLTDTTFRFDQNTMTWQVLQQLDCGESLQKTVKRRTPLRGREDTSPFHLHPPSVSASRVCSNPDVEQTEYLNAMESREEKKLSVQKFTRPTKRVYLINEIILFQKKGFTSLGVDPQSEFSETSEATFENINSVDTQVSLTNKQVRLMSGYIYPDTPSESLMANLLRWAYSALREYPFGDIWNIRAANNCLFQGADAHAKHKLDRSTSSIQAQRSIGKASSRNGVQVRETGIVGAKSFQLVKKSTNGFNSNSLFYTREADTSGACNTPKVSEDADADLASFNSACYASSQPLSELEKSALLDDAIYEKLELLLDSKKFRKINRLVDNACLFKVCTSGAPTTIKRLSWGANVLNSLSTPFHFSDADQAFSNSACFDVSSVSSQPLPEGSASLNSLTNVVGPSAPHVQRSELELNPTTLVKQANIFSVPKFNSISNCGVLEELGETSEAIPHTIKHPFALEGGVLQSTATKADDMSASQEAKMLQTSASAFHQLPPVVFSKGKRAEKMQMEQWNFSHHLGYFPGFIKPNQFIGSINQITQGNDLSEDLFTHFYDVSLNSNTYTSRYGKINSGERYSLSGVHGKKQNASSPPFDCSPRKTAYNGIVVQRNPFTKDFQFPPKKPFHNYILGISLFGPENPFTDRQSHFFGQRHLSTVDVNIFQRDYLRQLGKETLLQSNPKEFTYGASVDRGKILSFSKAINSFLSNKRKYTYLLEEKDQWHLLFQEQLRTALEDTRKYPPLTPPGEYAEERGVNDPGRIKVSAPLMMARFPKKSNCHKILAHYNGYDVSSASSYTMHLGCKGVLQAPVASKMQMSASLTNVVGPSAPHVQKSEFNSNSLSIWGLPKCSSVLKEDGSTSFQPLSELNIFANATYAPVHLLTSASKMHSKGASSACNAVPVAWSCTEGANKMQMYCNPTLFTETYSSQRSGTPLVDKSSSCFGNNNLFLLFGQKNSPGFTQEPLNANSWLIISQWSFLVALLFWIEQTFAADIFPALFALEQLLLGTTGMKSDDRTHVTRVSKGEVPKFKNIAGIDGLLGELAELVLFLRGHKKRLWNKKSSYGVLLTGPPGTGKTFLVRALANEAKVPVLILSAGVLTANKTNNSKPSWSIRHAFRRAKQLAPCILFIDEIDALGRSRGNIVTDINEIVADTKQNLQMSASFHVPSNSQVTGINPSLQQQLLSATETQVHQIQNTHGVGTNRIFSLRTEWEQGNSSYNQIDRYSLGADTSWLILPSGNKSPTFGAKSGESSLGDKTLSTDTSPDKLAQPIQTKENIKRKFGPLTQLLVSMDGVSSLSGVLIIGATNRPESLDPALTRPGRFERIIRVEKPAEQKRIEILKLYSRNLGVQKQIPWSYLANRTMGLTAADLAVAMNYSSLKAILQGTMHTIETIEYGLDSIARFSSRGYSPCKTSKAGRAQRKIFSLDAHSACNAALKQAKAEKMQKTICKADGPTTLVKEAGICIDSQSEQDADETSEVHMLASKMQMKHRSIKDADKTPENQLLNAVKRSEINKKPNEEISELNSQEIRVCTEGAKKMQQVEENVPCFPYSLDIAFLATCQEQRLAKSLDFLISPSPTIESSIQRSLGVASKMHNPSQIDFRLPSNQYNSPGDEYNLVQSELRESKLEKMYRLELNPFRAQWVYKGCIDAQFNQSICINKCSTLFPELKGGNGKVSNTPYTTLLKSGLYLSTLALQKEGLRRCITCTCQTSKADGVRKEWHFISPCTDSEDQSRAEFAPLVKTDSHRRRTGVHFLSPSSLEKQTTINFCTSDVSLPAVHRATKKSIVTTASCISDPSLSLSTLFSLTTKTNQIEKKRLQRLTQIAYYQSGKIVVQTLLPLHPPVALITLNLSGATTATSADTYIPIDGELNTSWSSFLESRLMGLYGGKASSLLLNRQHFLSIFSEKPKYYSANSCTSQADICIFPMHLCTAGALCKKMDHATDVSSASLIQPPVASSMQMSAFCKVRVHCALQELGYSACVRSGLDTGGLIKRFYRGNLFHSNIGTEEIQTATLLAAAMVNKWALSYSCIRRERHLHPSAFLTSIRERSERQLKSYSYNAKLETKNKFHRVPSVSNSCNAPAVQEDAYRELKSLCTLDTNLITNLLSTFGAQYKPSVGRPNTVVDKVSQYQPPSSIFLHNKTNCVTTYLFAEGKQGFSYSAVRFSSQNVATTIPVRTHVFQLLSPLQFSISQRDRFYPGWFRLYLPDIEATEFTKNVANYYYSQGLQTLTRTSSIFDRTGAVDMENSIFLVSSFSKKNKIKQVISDKVACYASPNRKFNGKLHPAPLNPIFTKKSCSNTNTAHIFSQKNWETISSGNWTSLQKLPCDYNDVFLLEKELIFDSLINNCFSKAFFLIDQNRQLTDYFADYLVRFQILRQHQILYLFSTVLFSCKKQR